MCSSPGPVLRVRRTRFRSCHLLPFGMVGAAVSLCERGLRSCLLLPDRLRTAFFFSPLLRSSRVSLGEWVGDWWGPGRYFCVGPSPPPRCLPSASVAGVEASGFIFFFPLVYEGSLSGFFFSTFLPECVGACFPYLPGPLPPLPRHCSPVCFFFFFFPLPVFWLSPVRFSLVSPGLLALQLASDGPLAFSWIDVVPSNSLRAGA